jgi:hypothetical protein
MHRALQPLLFRGAVAGYLELGLYLLYAHEGSAIDGTIYLDTGKVGPIPVCASGPSPLIAASGKGNGATVGIISCWTMTMDHAAPAPLRIAEPRLQLGAMYGVPAVSCASQRAVGACMEQWWCRVRRACS